MAESILFDARWPARGLDEKIASTDVDALVKEYRALVASAPSRSSVGKRYFVGHQGVKTSSHQSNRGEEHLASALWQTRNHWPRVGGGWFKMLDYQFPLKARQRDKGIGKVDILSLTDKGQLIVHELKVMGKSGSRGASPAAALMQGLRYTAIVEANTQAIAKEILEKWSIQVSEDKLIIQVLAPADPRFNSLVQP